MISPLTTYWRNMFFRQARPGAFTGAYDDIPNIVAAYGFRRLFTDYTGNLIRVRNNDTQDELDVGYTANGDLDTQAISDFLNGATGTIVTQYDQAPTGDATQATAAAQPEQIPNAQNGHTVGRWDGTDDGLATPVAQFVGNDGTWSALVVGKTNNTSGTEWFLDHDSRSGTTRIAQMIKVGSGNISSVAFNDSGSAFTDTGNSVGTGFNVLSAVRSSSAIETFVNGASDGPTATTGTPRVASHNLGIGALPDVSAGFLDGDMAEIVIANADWSSADHTAAREAAAPYWGVTLS